MSNYDEENRNLMTAILFFAVVVVISVILAIIAS